MPETVATDQVISSAVTASNSSMSPDMLAQIAGLFNITAGLLLVGGTLLFGMGLASYVAHFGLPSRDEGLHNMQNGLSMFFILIIMLGVVRFVQSYTAYAITIVGALLLFGLGWAILKVVQEANAVEDEH